MLHHFSQLKRRQREAVIHCWENLQHKVEQKFQATKLWLIILIIQHLTLNITHLSRLYFLQSVLLIWSNWVSDSFHQVHKEKAGQDLQALQVLLDLVVPLDVQDMPESAGLLDLLDTATLLSVLVFLTTGRDTEVRIRTCRGGISPVLNNIV